MEKTTQQFKVKTIEEMQKKLSDGLNQNKKVIITNEDIGFTVEWV